MAQSQMAAWRLPGGEITTCYRSICVQESGEEFLMSLADVEVGLPNNASRFLLLLPDYTALGS